MSRHAGANWGNDLLDGPKHPLWKCESCGEARNFASRIRCRCGEERKNKAEIKAAKARDMEAKAKLGNRRAPQTGDRSERKTVPPQKPPPWKADRAASYAGTVAKNEQALAERIKVLEKKLEDAEARIEAAKDDKGETTMAVDEPMAGENLEQRIKDLEEGIAVFTKLGKAEAAEELKQELELAKQTKEAERPIGSKIRAAKRRVQTFTRRAEKTGEELDSLKKEAEELREAIAKKELENQQAVQELADAQKALSTLTVQEVLPTIQGESDPFARERAFAGTEEGASIKLKLAQLDQLRDEIRKEEQEVAARRQNTQEQTLMPKNGSGSPPSAATACLGGRPSEVDDLAEPIAVGAGALRPGGTGKGGSSYRSHPYGACG